MPGQMLERVERRPLGGEHRARIAVEAHQRGAVPRRVAVVRQLLDRDIRIERAEECRGDLQPGDDDRLPAVHLGREARVGIDRRVRGHVAARPEILGENAA